MFRPLVCIVTPALASANNGNWQTAWRWSQMLRSHYRTELTDRWQAEPADALVALHARKSADSIQRWASERPGRPLTVVLDGVDELGRELHAEGRCRNALFWHGYPYLYQFWCMAEWDFDGHSGVVGEEQDFFPLQQARRYLRGLRESQVSDARVARSMSGGRG